LLAAGQRICADGRWRKPAICAQAGADQGCADHFLAVIKDDRHPFTSGRLRTMMIIPSNAVVRYAVHPAEQGAIEYIDGMQQHWPPLPHEGDTLTVPFLVDPVTRQPIPVRVAQIAHLLQMDPPTIAVVVSRVQ
jgi:hypothetical protein